VRGYCDQWRQDEPRRAGANSAVTDLDDVMIAWPVVRKALHVTYPSGRITNDATSKVGSGLVI
jgi:hypothetical protein